MTSLPSSQKHFQYHSYHKQLQSVKSGGPKIAAVISRSNNPKPMRKVFQTAYDLLTNEYLPTTIALGVQKKSSPFLDEVIRA